MEESPTLESENQPLKTTALAAYKQFINRGVTNPDNLDLEDIEVKKANELYYKWKKEIDSQAGEDEEKKIRVNLEKTMFYVDAGFTDHQYLDMVLNYWLAQDSQSTEKDVDNLERNITRQKIATAMSKIRRIMQSQKNTH